MRVAIIGAGLAGLSTAYFLLKNYPEIHLVLFEAKKGGGGASRVCSGLLHPYPGFNARRSHLATEALIVTKMLLKLVEERGSRSIASDRGIIRICQNEEQKKRLMEQMEEWGDIQWLGDNKFLIQSGITVISEKYLEGLSSLVSELGAKWVFERVSDLNVLSSFDHIVIAAGSGVADFSICASLPIEFLKGQVLSLKGAPPVPMTTISKGYTIHLGSDFNYEVGSTYERKFQDEMPDRVRAVALLQELLSKCGEGEIIGCQAAIRVCRIGGYRPIIDQLSERVSVFTALGSRGLLYHGLYGQMLAEKIGELLI